MMHSDNLQQNAFQNPQSGVSYPQQGVGLGQAAFGGFGNPLGGQSGWGWGAQQRQLSQQDVSAILQQIAPVLPQIIAQAQQNPYQTMAAFGGAQRSLSPQDVNEVVRQILPMIPQLLQSIQQSGGQFGFGQTGPGQSGPFGSIGQGWQGQAAYGLGPQNNFGGVGQQNPFTQGSSRHLSHHDVSEIARQLSEAIQQQQAYAGQSRF